MAQSINLIPQEERLAQTKTKVVKVSTILTVVLLVIVGGVGGYYFYRASTIKSELNNLETQVNSLRSDISQLKDMEINARNLYKKSTALGTIFSSRVYYSKMLSALEQSTPEGILIDSFGLGTDQTVAISGRANTYNDVQSFTNRLLERELFTEVELKSVGLESRQEKVNFFIVVSYDLGLLHE